MAQNRPARRQLPHIWCNALLRPMSASGGSRRTLARARRSPARYAEGQRATPSHNDPDPERRGVPPRTAPPSRPPHPVRADLCVCPGANRLRSAAGNPTARSAVATARRTAKWRPSFAAAADRAPQRLTASHSRARTLYAVRTPHRGAQRGATFMVIGDHQGSAEARGCGHRRPSMRHPEGTRAESRASTARRTLAHPDSPPPRLAQGAAPRSQNAAIRPTAGSARTLPPQRTGGGEAPPLARWARAYGSVVRIRACLFDSCAAYLGPM